jgi:hypothetical protein
MEKERGTGVREGICVCVQRSRTCNGRRGFGTSLRKEFGAHCQANEVCSVFDYVRGRRYLQGFPREFRFKGHVRLREDLTPPFLHPLFHLDMPNKSLSFS